MWAQSNCFSCNRGGPASTSTPMRQLRQSRRWRTSPRVQASVTLTQPQPTSLITSTEKPAFFYSGVVFDMDGTLTEAHIPFDDMRRRTGIPVGDLFTVMESWQDEGRVRSAMDVILEIEADAARRVRLKEGLLELLQMLRERQVPVALVTRNTPASVAAFFTLLGPQWEGFFDPVLTREFDYVKPDRRLLLHVAKVWGVEPSQLLMVGDSLEDVEVGNAAGSASCLVAGGGNEAPGRAPPTPPPGAQPTFTVSGLPELRARLVAASDLAVCHLLAQGAQLVSESAAVPSVAASALAAAVPDLALPLPGSLAETSTEDEYASFECEVENGCVALGWPARVAAGERVSGRGAPAPGLAFIDWLVAAGALRLGATSFPRMGAAAGGLATCGEELRGDRVLHLGCGSGALTKLIASQGMQVVGMDLDPGPALRRGLSAVAYGSLTRPLSPRSLKPARAVIPGGLYDVVLIRRRKSDHDATQGPDFLSNGWWTPEGLAEISSVLTPEGRLCAEVPAAGIRAANPARIINSINNSGFTVVCWSLERQQLRLVAQRQRVGAIM